jgi:cysteine-rich repeat protein
LIILVLLLAGGASGVRASTLVSPLPMEIGDCLPNGVIDVFDVLTEIDILLGRKAPTTIQRVLCDVDCNGQIELLDVLREIDLLLGRLTPPLFCPSTCGNAVIEGSEECDDGGTSSGDGCDGACQLESMNPAVCAGVPTVAGTNLHAVPIASGLEAPVHIAAPRLDPSRVFIVEQPGRIQIVKNGVQLGAPFLAIEGIVLYGGEQGLLSVAFDPDYEANRFFYVYYVNNAGNLVISRFEANPGNPDDALEASEHIITTIAHPGQTNHNGGNLNFGPDGFLYAATGDGGGVGDPSDNAQNDASGLGKLLQIDVHTGTVTNWAKGLRNPFRFSFDRATGDLYIGDVGQGSWEEIDYDPAPITAGTNYGWDDMEGRHCFEPAVGCLTAGRTLPVLEYCNSGCVSAACSVAACSVFQQEKGQAVIGGFVYRGCVLPDLHGEYFYSDTYGTWIHTFTGVSGGDAQSVLDRSGQLGSHSVTSFGEDARGELYFTDYGTGEAYKIVPN